MAPVGALLLVVFNPVKVTWLFVLFAGLPCVAMKETVSAWRFALADVGVIEKICTPVMRPIPVACVDQFVADTDPTPLSGGCHVRYCNWLVATTKRHCVHVCC